MSPPPPDSRRVIVIAHRGASGYRPEHTVAAYQLAIDQGADFIEPDLVMTRDRVLIARHDLLLDATTNVAELPQFASRRTTKTVSGKKLSGWFAEDLTLDEVQQLRSRERLAGDPAASFRPANTPFDDRLQVPTLTEVVELARATGVGIYPEIKHPTHVQAATGVDMTQVLLDTLQADGINRFDDLPTYIQSFEVGSLQSLDRAMPRCGMSIPLVQLLAPRGGPVDDVSVAAGLTYDQMATPAGLAEIATYAIGVGPHKYHFVLPLDDAGNLDIKHKTSFVDDAHAAGLLVHPYTFRAENRALPRNLQGDAPQDPFQLGNAVDEMELFIQTGIDGFFTDHPDLGREAVGRQ